MDENEAVAEQQMATPIFNVYRRGYDPEQVDRYVADQQRRLDDALRRASESERRLAAAVGQLRELHRRVAVYESETRTAQPPALDTLGERVQRILQEAWEGAYSLRQEAEREVNELRETVAEEVSELREVASREAADVVDQATRRALAIRDETERRRHAYLQRIEQDREPRSFSDHLPLRPAPERHRRVGSTADHCPGGRRGDGPQSSRTPGAGRRRSGGVSCGDRRHSDASLRRRHAPASRSRFGQVGCSRAGRATRPGGWRRLPRR